MRSGPKPKIKTTVQPPPAAKRAPPGLSRGALRFWRTYASDLIALGVLTKPDRAAFELMAEHHAIARQAARILAEEGPTTKDERGLIRKHPADAIMRLHSAAYRSYASTFGLLPSARQRLEVEPPDVVDELSELMNRHARQAVTGE